VSGTLLEGIALWGELKPQLTQDAVAARAMAYCDTAVAQGLLAIRSHVDICDDRLLAVDALLDVQRRVAPYLELQLVAFPQDGFVPRTRRRISCARSIAASASSAASRISSAPWPTVLHRCAAYAKSQPNADCSSTCTATSPTIRCRGTSRHSPP
jgi:cytosine/adenosine deaminase-related metal-dependent hydrolase